MVELFSGERRRQTSSARSALFNNGMHASERRQFLIHAPSSPRAPRFLSPLPLCPICDRNR